MIGSHPSRHTSDPDSDVDGAPLDGLKLLKGSSTPSARLPAGFVPSKWETVDPEEVQAQAVTSKWDIFDQASISISSNSIKKYVLITVAVSRNKTDNLIMLHYDDRTSRGNRSSKTMVETTMTPTSTAFTWTTMMMTFRFESSRNWNAPVNNSLLNLSSSSNILCDETIQLLAKCSNGHSASNEWLLDFFLLDVSFNDPRAARKSTRA